MRDYAEAKRMNDDDLLKRALELEREGDRLAILAVGALILTVAFGLSFVLAIAGEPSSVWFWSQITRLGL